MKERTMDLEIFEGTKADLPRGHFRGRERRESPFDKHVPTVYAACTADPEKWFHTPYDGTDEGFTKLKNELARAAKNAGYGKSAKPSEKDGQHLFSFRIHDKMNTGRRGSSETPDETETDGQETGSGDDQVESQNGSVESGEVIEETVSVPRNRRGGRGSRDTANV
jgi:hypothetical protein